MVMLIFTHITHLVKRVPHYIVIFVINTQVN